MLDVKKEPNKSCYIFLEKMQAKKNPEEREKPEQKLKCVRFSQVFNQMSIDVKMCVVVQFQIEKKEEEKREKNEPRIQPKPALYHFTRFFSAVTLVVLFSYMDSGMNAERA